MPVFFEKVESDDTAALEAIDENVLSFAQKTPVIIHVDEPVELMEKEEEETSLPPLKTSSSFVRLPGKRRPQPPT